MIAVQNKTGCFLDVTPGAGSGNRTRVSSLARTCSTTKPYPLLSFINNSKIQNYKTHFLERLPALSAGLGYYIARCFSISLRSSFDNEKPFESCRKASSCFPSRACALGRTRTHNTTSEALRDIHFTTRALPTIILYISRNSKIILRFKSEKPSPRYT